ncbi:MAG: hypothetical protein RLZZ312_1276 [Bacteroidota bacterium]|jgi:outer membrane protein
MKNKIHYGLFALLISLQNFAQVSKKWTLRECVDYSIANNISIKQTNLDSKTAEVEKLAARGGFLPNINAQSSHSWNIGLNQNITTGLLENQTTQFTAAGLNANVVIYNGLQNINRLRRSNLSILSAQYNLSKIKDDISLNVANSFLQVLFNKENLKVQRNQLQNNQKQLERSQQLVAAGAIPRGDLLDLNATVAANKQSIVIAENTLFLSKLSLAQLLQLPDFQNFDTVDTDYAVAQSAAMLQTPTAIYEKAKAERVELKIAKTNLDIAEKDVAIARGAYQPTISGFYGFNTRASDNGRFVGVEQNTTNPTSVIGFVQGTNQQVLQPNLSPIIGNALPLFTQFDNNKGNNFGLQLSVPILNGFSARNAVQRAKINVERNQIALSQQELTLERNVFTAFADAKGSLQAYESAIVAQDSRRDAYEYAKERFAVGLLNAFDLNQAQTLFVNAQSEVVRTKYDYIFKTKVVEFYFGIPIIQN